MSMRTFDYSDGALWKMRFQAPKIWWFRTAPGAPDRGLVCTDKDGIAQLYAWDIASGNLDRRTGVIQALVLDGTAGWASDNMQPGLAAYRPDLVTRSSCLGHSLGGGRFLAARGPIALRIK